MQKKINKVQRKNKFKNRVRNKSKSQRNKIHWQNHLKKCNKKSNNLHLNVSNILWMSKFLKVVAHVHLLLYWKSRVSILNTTTKAGMKYTRKPFNVSQPHLTLYWRKILILKLKSFPKSRVDSFLNLMFAILFLHLFWELKFKDGIAISNG